MVLLNSDIHFSFFKTFIFKLSLQATFCIHCYIEIVNIWCIWNVQPFGFNLSWSIQKDRLDLSKVRMMPICWQMAIHMDRLSPSRIFMANDNLILRAKWCTCLGWVYFYRSYHALSKRGRLVCWERERERDCWYNSITVPWSITDYN